MRLFLFRSILFIFGLGVFIPMAIGQQMSPDTLEISQEARNAKTDEIFFDAMKAKMHNDDKQAEKLFTQFAEKRPEVSDADYELAILSYNKKELEKARDYIKKAISIDSTNKWYKEEYATILADQDDFTGAAAVMGSLSIKFPEDRTYPLMAAEYYEHARKYDDAIYYLDKAIAQVGSEDDIMLRKAQIYMNLNKPDKAADVMEELIARDPKNGKNYKMLGELYDNNKQPEKAGEVFAKALKIIPDDPFVQLGLADHSLKTGDTAAFQIYVKKVVLNKDLDVDIQLDFLRTYIQSLPTDSVSVRQKALPIIKQLVAQHLEDADVLDFYGLILEVINRPDSAIEVFKQSLIIKPADFDTWTRLLQLYSDRHSSDSLLKYSTKALRLFPNQGNFHFYNGVGHYYKKDYSAAVQSLNRAIDMIPDSDRVALSGVYSFLGDIYHADKKDDLSDKSYSKALELTPDNATVLNNYSYYLSERGVKLDQAEKMSKRAMELNPGEATFLDTYGWILYKKGEYAKAKEYVQKAIALSGDNADATLYDHLGNICYKLNDAAGAIENWKKAKEKGIEDPIIDKKITEGKLYE